MKKHLFPKILICILFLSALVFAQRDLGVRPTESGGVLMAEQAAFDVQSYDLDLRVNPSEQSIKGVLTVKALIVKPIEKFVLDLDAPLTVESVSLVNGEKRETLKFERTEKQIWITLPKMPKKGKTVEISVAYGGKPRVAPRPPWVGGFVWAKTADGQPWFATAVQMDGSDLWFPVKDHPSDKPETTTLHFTVPEPLVAASNGRLQSVVKNADGTQTFNWFISQPISNYNIALNVAPYKLIEDKMQSITGETIPIAFYVLPEHFDKGKSLVDKTKDYVRFFEEYLGPYPFRADKLGIAHTPHLGMEHQSIIAYGNDFRYDANGFDWLMFHELGHEWWANLVTAKDWNDFWIHEGFQSFMDAFYAEKILGREQFIKSLPNRIKNTKNLKAVAPREAKTTREMYMIPPDYTRSDGDIYGKGALVLNSLRGLIGDEAFFKSLRKMCYPNAAMEKITNGKQVRFVTTDDFLQIAEQASGKDLDWFFEVYLRQPKLPKLIAETKPNELVLRWDVPNSLPFPLPVEVKIAGETKRVEMRGGTATIALPNDVVYEIDPNGWLLKAE
ncbi:MAG: M1 family metallopeptidase [Acidobacteriota bacterium]|nr:M1 family metallopeptidase [Acidobacteriota bacterium]